MSDQTTTLPIPPDVFWALTRNDGFALLTLVIFGAMILLGYIRIGPMERLKTRLGLTELNSGLFLIALAFWGALFVTLTVGLIWLIWELIRMVLTVNKAMVWTLPWLPVPEDTAKILGFSIARIAGLTATLGAVVALPFTLIKVRMTGEQTRTAQEGLFNEKIKAASDDLHAMRQRWDKKAKQNVWERDIVRRNAAIQRLAGLVAEHPQQASRVSQLLSTYVRERSKENPPIEFDESEEKPFLQEWGHHSFTPSTDVEQAVRALGQLVKITGVRKEDVSIDLRGANLQGFDLSDFQQLKPDYTNANFQGAHMQCANLSSATLDGAFLREAKLQGACLDNTFLRPTSHPANLIYARLQKAYFRNSNMPDVLIKGARLGNAIFEGATLSGARIEWSDLKGTNFQSAIMRGVILDGQVLDLTGLKMDERTRFRDADLTGAAIRRVSFPTPWENPRYFPFSQDQVTAMYYDASVKWPEFVSVSSDRPDQALTEDAFHTAWRAFQASIGFDPDDPATW